MHEVTAEEPAAEPEGLEALLAANLARLADVEAAVRRCIRSRGSLAALVIASSALNESAAALRAAYAARAFGAPEAPAPPRPRAPRVPAQAGTRHPVVLTVV